MAEVIDKIFDFAPKEILRIIVGSVILGFVLLLFLMVLDDRFNPSDAVYDWCGLIATPLLAMLLCMEVKPIKKWALKMVASSMVVFAVGFTSTNVIASLVQTLNGEVPPQVEVAAAPTRGLPTALAPVATLDELLKD